MTSSPKTVLFACVHNAGRSQMAAAWFNSIADPKMARALSAGTRPASAPHPEVVTVMREAGMDLTGAKPQFLSESLASATDILITMGCGEECPVVPGVERMDWALPDPKGQPLPEVRRIRDEIEARVRALVKDRGWK